MLKNLLVGLSLAVLRLVPVLRVRCDFVAWLKEGSVLLNVARRTAASWSGETDVGGHIVAGWLIALQYRG